MNKRQRKKLDAMNKLNDIKAEYKVSTKQARKMFRDTNREYSKNSKAFNNNFAKKYFDEINNKIKPLNIYINEYNSIISEIEKYANYKNKILSSRYGSFGPDITEVPGLNVKTLQPYYDEMDEWYRTTNAGDKHNIGQSYRKMQEILGGHVFEHEIETLILFHDINKGGPIGTAAWLANMTRAAVIDAFSDVAYNYHSDMYMEFLAGD